MDNNYKTSRPCIGDIINNPFEYAFDELTTVVGKLHSAEIYALLYGKQRKRRIATIWPIQKTGNTDTSKYLFELFDGNRIETACIKRRTGITACVSTQVGCAVQCAFCASGQNGLKRNLTASEIVQQVVWLKEPINRIVFMGIGEPLHNYKAVIKSIHILREREGLDFPTDGITISTVGPIAQLKRLREEHLKIQLVLSLHATTQRVRDRLIPGMKHCLIGDTIAAALSYGERHRRKITIAYLLLPGINNMSADIRNLASYFSGKDVRINLLPFNKTFGDFRNASASEMLHFKKELEGSGLEVSIRESHGRNIQAACGQLASVRRKW